MASVTDPAHDPGADRVEADATTGKLSLHPAHPATEPSDVFLRQKPVRREHAIAQEPDSLFARNNHAIVLVDLEAQRLQESLDFQAHLMEPPLVVGEDQEVINVADVTQPEPVGHIMIEWIEVNVQWGPGR